MGLREKWARFLDNPIVESSLFVLGFALVIISPLVGAGSINQNDFSLAGLIVSFLGAVILLAIVNLFRRGRMR